MDRVPENLARSLGEHGQAHVLAWWDELSSESRAGLVKQLEGLNLRELRELYERRNEKANLPPVESIAPLPRPGEPPRKRHRLLEAQIQSNLPPDDAQLRLGRFRRDGENALRWRSVAFLIVAGGQGSRLGFEHPKGMFAIGPVSNKSLFQIHAEKVLALSRKFTVSSEELKMYFDDNTRVEHAQSYAKTIPLFIMTSSATHAETVDFFFQNNYFGLSQDRVTFFEQGAMPALDLETGRLLMEAKDRLFLGPNGHGGTITGLAEHGLLTWMKKHGVKTISYFQVDNPLVNLADYVFLGQHLAQHAEVSSKVVVKQFPTEKLGNLALIDGRCGIIEYSDLPESLANATDDQGRPTFWAGNPAIHLFDVDFLDRMTTQANAMPWHLARKKVPHLNDMGELIQPQRENALKFERFIFDVLPQAKRWATMATTRPAEFEPVKNATGAESPATARQAMSDLAGSWLETHGVHVPRDADGHVTVPIEISPLAALEADDLVGRVSSSVQVAGPLYLE